VLAILLAAVVLYAAFDPFDQLLLQSGFPGRQSLLMASAVFANVILNLLFIPRLGLAGAALATACSFAAAAVLLLVASWKWLGYPRSVLFDDTP
jgi:O-antigen/teichoic acid export membrane protein